jgi:hemolysin D
MNLMHKLEACSKLLRRYRSVFSFYWAHRKELSRLSFESVEAEFLSASLSLQARPVSPVGRSVAFILIAMIIVLLAWSIFGQIDITVNAPGKIIPSSRTKTIASVEVASVRTAHAFIGIPFIDVLVSRLRR